MRHSPLRVLLLALVAALLFAAAPATSASASYSTLKSASKTWGDCTMRVNLSRELVYQNGDRFRAGGNISCTQRHLWTTTKVTLKRNTIGVVGNTSSSSNSYGMGTNWLYAIFQAPRFACYNYQVLVEFSVAGLGSNYLTSGSPATYCDLL
jgi:hypothetical protein